MLSPLDYSLWNSCLGEPQQARLLKNPLQSNCFLEIVEDKEISAC